MVLDLGSGSLFRPQALEQETGLIKNRWGQDGSTILNFYTSTSADVTIHTVTAGKRLFIDSITVSATSASAVNIRLVDNGIGGTSKINIYVPGNETRTVNLNTPIYFDTDMYLDTNAASGVISTSGWEEPSS